MSPQPITVLVIGASRGIGRSLVLAFAESPDDQVIGSVRKPEDGEYGLPNASSIILNLKKPDSIAQAVQKTNTIDILVLNAGMGLAESILDLDEKEFQNYLDINVVGPWRVVKAFLPALQSGTEKKVVFTSSISGSMAANYEGKASVRGAYALTKAAINMFALQLHQDLGPEGFTVVPIHPGWVNTALCNPDSYQGAMPPAESAAGISKVVLGLKKGDSGKFFQWNGENLPWGNLGADSRLSGILSSEMDSGWLTYASLSGRSSISFESHLHDSLKVEVSARLTHLRPLIPCCLLKKTFDDPFGLP